MIAENTPVLIPDERILDKIYLVRGQKVMLDKDLATLFSVKAIRLREQVKRNPDKFPQHFMFQLTESETDFMVSQNAIPSKKHLGGTLPYVFSEYGVLQLANVLNSSIAIQMSIKIIEIFVSVRQVLSDTLSLKQEIETIRQKVHNQDKNIELVFNYLDELITKQDTILPRRRIGYKVG
jgi:hypothetical protein